LIADRIPQGQVLSVEYQNHLQEPLGVRRLKDPADIFWQDF
jgi:hypothetical protein